MTTFLNLHQRNGHSGMIDDSEACSVFGCLGNLVAQDRYP